MDSKNGVIYCIRNKVNNKRYIGQTSQFLRRKYGHLSSLRSGTHHNSHLQSSWNKYGEDNFEFIKLIKNVHIKDLDNLERMMIEKHNSLENGYNQTVGGKILRGKDNPMYGVSMELTDEHKAKISNSLTGRTVSEETRKKIGKAHKGKIITKEQRKMISESRKGKCTGKNNYMYKHPGCVPHAQSDRMKVCSQTSWACPEERADGFEL